MKKSNSQSENNIKNNLSVKNGINKYGDLYQTNEDISDIIQKEIKAVRIIERAWCTYRDKQMFRLLKHAICAAEHSLSKEILRKIVPQESSLLNDRIFNVKIKFRFSGPEFPPFIVFKIFAQTCDGKTAKYINGKNTIKPTSSAAVQACNQMGSRQYYNLIILDTLQQKSNGKVIDQESIVSLKDYMQYTSAIDDLPAYVGGKSNSWRRLNLTDLPRYTIFYDVLNFAINKKMSSNLAKEMPVLLLPPTNPDIQNEQIKIISKLEIPDEINSRTLSYLNSSNYKSTLSQVSSRRSKQAINKVSKMKKVYSVARSETVTSDPDMYQPTADRSDSFKLPEDLNDDFETEVKNLYMWTQNLSINDDYVNTPRLPTAF